MISNFTKYIQEFDSLTKDLLNCTNVYLTEDDAVWFFTLSKWKFRLKQQGKLILFSNKNKKIVNEDTLTLAEIHYLWLLNFLIIKSDQLSGFINLPADL